MEIELNPDQEASIIPAAVYFLRSLTTSLGSEVGLHVWDKINATLGNDIKGKVFFAMLTGQVGTEIILRGLKPIIGLNSPNKVDVIKCIRGISGLTLYDAKVVADAVFTGVEQRIKCQEFIKRDYWVKHLHTLGVDAF